MEVFSFSEAVLLNKKVLDVICPMKRPGCELKSQEVRVKDLGALHLTLENHTFRSAVSNKPHVIRRVVGCVARVAVIALTSLIVAPIGVVVNSARVLAALAVFAVKKGDERWQKVVDLSNCFFKDLRCFALGAVFATTIASSVVSFGLVATVAMPVIAKVIFIGTGLVTAGTGAVGFGVASAQAPLMYLRDKTSNAGLCTSYYLREELGLVNEEGGLLKFSKGDTLLVKDDGFVAGSLFDSVFSKLIRANVNEINCFAPKGQEIKHCESNSSGNVIIDISRQVAAWGLKGDDKQDAQAYIADLTELLGTLYQIARS